eukprot:551709-Prorocentrum_minimum.AAC.1
MADWLIDRLIDGPSQEPREWDDYGQAMDEMEVEADPVTGGRDRMEVDASEPQDGGTDPAVADIPTKIVSCTQQLCSKKGTPEGAQCLVFMGRPCDNNGKGAHDDWLRMSSCANSGKDALNTPESNNTYIIIIY